MTGNKQSQLLQEVRGVLANTYSTTHMRADGQVVVVPFNTYAVEVVPAFTAPNSDQFWICDTHNGGSYKTTDPKAEIANVRDSDDASSGNSRDLIRMLKRWQDHCNVPLKSFCLELLAVDFLSSWSLRPAGKFLYDWLVRDFFEFLAGKGSWSSVLVPGTWEWVSLGDGWSSKAATAHSRAVKACDCERDEMPYSAGEEWQKIFGNDIPTG